MKIDDQRITIHGKRSSLIYRMDNGVFRYRIEPDGLKSRCATMQLKG